ncbi:dynamin family protein [Aeromonas veronii]|nr:dynamin family protein [Aeromonas veronii]MBL0455237.1 dynamin family protein [Aeromonas veronii]
MFVNKIEDFLIALDEHKFPDDYADLKSIASDFSTKLQRWQKQEQTLNIGIMGQVKAGKSTFLNALLFDGRPILPEAATPKTANLTKVVYGDRYSLHVEYYNQNEWREITDLAERQGDSDEIKVARELVTMASASGLGLAEHWQRFSDNEATDILFAEDIAGLQGLLNQYAGNDGRYTALVKSTVLTLPSEELKGFEVVDTPGMNDPVQSRSQKTRDYMANCDVVFFLSRCSQFLDESDVSLLSEQLPNKGVKRLVLVAGQFDSAIDDDGPHRGSLDEADNNVRRRLQRGAADRVVELVTKSRERGQDARAKVLEQLAQPVFASTFAYGFANWPEARWSDSMRHTHRKFQEMAEEYWDKPITPEQWQRLANFDALKAAYQQARRDRLPLLELQRQGFEQETQERLIEWRNGFAERIKQRIHLLKTQDLQSLALQQQHCDKRLSAIANELKAIVESVTAKARNDSGEMLSQLARDRGRFRNIQTRSSTKEVTRSYEVSTSRWYNPFSWGSTRTEYYTDTVSYDYLNAGDAIEQVRDFGAQCADQMRSHINRLISPHELKSSLRKALLKHLDTKSDHFDPALFRSTLEGAINRLSMPTLRLSLGDATSIIPFSGQIKERDEMEMLRRYLDQALGNVFDRLEKQLDKGINQVLAQLEALQTSLKEELTRDLRSELDQVRQGLQHKEQELAKYDELLTRLSTI